MTNVKEDRHFIFIEGDYEGWIVLHSKDDFESESHITLWAEVNNTVFEKVNKQTVREISEEQYNVVDDGIQKGIFEEASQKIVKEVR